VPLALDKQQQLVNQNHVSLHRTSFQSGHRSATDTRNRNVEPPLESDAANILASAIAPTQGIAIGCFAMSPCRKDVVRFYFTILFKEDPNLLGGEDVSTALSSQTLRFSQRRSEVDA
ncbi:MAG: hypothetical protein WBD31_07810, partial [Rubripirellula sp.]